MVSRRGLQLLRLFARHRMFRARELACFVAALGLAHIWALVSLPIDVLGRRQPWDAECCGHLDAMRWHSTSVGHAVFVSRHDACAMFM